MRFSPEEQPLLRSKPSRTINASLVCPIHFLSSNTHAYTLILGKPVSHQFAKEVLAGLAGVEADRLIETRGADYIDKEKAQRDAKRNAEQMYDDHYGDQDHYDPQQQQPPQRLQREFGNDRW